MALDLAGAQSLMMPKSDVDPLAALHMLVTDPEAIIPHLAAAGIPPPDRNKLQAFAEAQPARGNAVDAINQRFPSGYPPLPSSSGMGSAFAPPSPYMTGDGRIDPNPTLPPPNPLSTIAGSGILAMPGVAAPGETPVPVNQATVPLPSPRPPVQQSPFADSTSTEPAQLPPIAAPVAEPQAAGTPLDITTNPLPGASKVAGSKGAIDDAIRTLQGVRLPTQPAFQKLDSPRVVAGHPVNPAAATGIASLLEKIAGGPASLLRLNQTVR